MQTIKLNEGFDSLRRILKSKQIHPKSKAYVLYETAKHINGLQNKLHRLWSENIYLRKMVMGHHQARMANAANNGQERPAIPVIPSIPGLAMDITNLTHNPIPILGGHPMINVEEGLNDMRPETSQTLDLSERCPPMPLLNNFTTMPMTPMKQDDVKDESDTEEEEDQPLDLSMK